MTLWSIGLFVLAAVALTGVGLLWLASQIFQADPAAGLFDAALGMACLLPAAFVVLKLPGAVIAGSCSAVLALVATVIQTVVH